MSAAGWALLSAALACGCERIRQCESFLEPPGFADRRTVGRDEACARLDAALRERCPPDHAFSCGDYYPADCSGAQRETDVARCEQRVACSRTCDEALEQTCGMTCEQAPPPALPG
jgi:hypothetical protein